jgi:hypothetical protein
MAQNSAGTDAEQAHELTVDPDTIISGLKINSKPGEERRVLFHKNMHGNYGSGTLRDVRGLMWDGEGPIQLRPRDFLREDIGDYLEARTQGKRVAEEEGGDPDKGAEVAAKEWEDQARAWLQEEIVVEPRIPEETRTVYHISYESDE